MLNALAINGSPNKDGSTAFLLTVILDKLAKEGIKTRMVHIGGSNIHGCRSCWTCAKTKNKRCDFRDDMFNSLFTDVLEADALILGSPSYIAGMSSEMKAFIDRAGLVSFNNNRPLRHKVGAAVVSQRRAGGTSVQATINHMFLMNEMVIPGSIYWNIAIGHQKSDIAKDEVGMMNMFNLAQNIAWLLKKLNPEKVDN